MKHAAILKDDVPQWMRAAFPNGAVPIVSLTIVLPRPEGPQCYLLDDTALTPTAKGIVALALFNTWEECSCIEEALDYIESPGLPLSLDHFSLIETSIPPISVLTPCQPQPATT
jgi:hypothetical protein